jgi:peptidoglycan/LPS O-acetylase OafA/YrhL
MSEDSEQFLASGDEAGTAPEDRKLRPDVEGMRAVAIILVLFTHFAIPGFAAGIIGVDVFFVISGFVITGVLLRERAARGRTSLAHFYARRARRIIPLATLVVVVTLVCERYANGRAAARAMASPARWVVLFAYNLDHAALTNELIRAQPLQPYWSLAVEEQFYLVYPAVFLVVGLVLSRWSWRVKANLVLGAGVVASFIWSVVSSAPLALIPYTSSLTRAWELAIGCLIAINTPVWRKVPTWLAGSMTWLGLALVVTVSLTLSLVYPYPGWIAILPVTGTALVIVGGTPTPAWGVEGLLARGPVRLVGRWSYGLYLWEIPVLVLAGHWWGDAIGLPVIGRWGLIAATLVIAGVSFVAYESPIRHSARLVASPSLSLVCALGFIVVSLVAISLVSR